jgi:hypothetical protein
MAIPPNVNSIKSRLAAIWVNRIARRRARRGSWQALPRGRLELMRSGVSKSLVRRQLADALPVPIPAAFPLFAAGLGAMGFMARRKKRKVAVAG